MAILVRNGVWGLSQIISDRGGLSCSAMINNPTARIDAHYPPLNRTLRQYTVPFCAVWCPDGLANTTGSYLIPHRIDIDELTVGGLAQARRTTILNALTSRLASYSYTDPVTGLVVDMPAIDPTQYSPQTTLREVILDIYRYLGHSEYRQRPMVVESHNTEYLDDFSTDPTARWTGIMGSAPTWDSANSEYDGNTSDIDAIHAYSANNPGSIEQEAQITMLQPGTASSDGAGTVIRIDRTASDGYLFQPSRQNATHWIVRYNGGVRTTVATLGTLSLSTNIFITERAAASGGIGANVALSLWMTDHGASKPSDPGWVGVDASPDQTTTDTSVDRLDASTHIECGFGWTALGTDWDTRCCFFKERAISDRSAVGGQAYRKRTGGIPFMSSNNRGVW